MTLEGRSHIHQRLILIQEGTQSSWPLQQRTFPLVHMGDTMYHWARTVLHCKSDKQLQQIRIPLLLHKCSMLSIPLQGPLFLKGSSSSWLLLNHRDCRFPRDMAHTVKTPTYSPVHN